MTRVIVIEDDPTLGESLAELLSLWSYKVTLLDSFKAFFNFKAMLADQDLVISDFYLGDGTYRQVAEELRTKDLLNKTICMTAAADEGDLNFAKTNAQILLLKPFRVECLRDAIDSCREN